MGMDTSVVTRDGQAFGWDEAKPHEWAHCSGEQDILQDTGADPDCCKWGIFGE